MLLNEYQAAAWRTNTEHPPDVGDLDVMRIWMALGLAGEAGEVANLVKKNVLHRTLWSVDAKSRLTDELGDVLWYIAGLASHYGLTLDDIVLANIDKLQKRYPNGWQNAT